MSDSLLSDAGSLFFIAWILVVAAVSFVAFGHDLFPAKARVDSYQGRASAVPRKAFPKE